MTDERASARSMPWVTVNWLGPSGQQGPQNAASLKRKDTHCIDTASLRSPVMEAESAAEAGDQQSGRSSPDTPTMRSFPGETGSAGASPHPSSLIPDLIPHPSPRPSPALELGRHALWLCPWARTRAGCSRTQTSCLKRVSVRPCAGHFSRLCIACPSFSRAGGSAWYGLSFPFAADLTPEDHTVNRCDPGRARGHS